MGTSVSLGDYEPEKVKEPWEESHFRDLSRAYYTQSVNMKINKLNHCITALTSLEINKCYTYPETDSEFISDSPRTCYLSALTIYMDNKGKIIKGEKILTTFVVIYDKNTPRSNRKYILDTSFRVRQEKEICVDGKELHGHVIKNKQIHFRNGKVYSLNKFHDYIVEASICNRRTDVNYTNMKVTKNRDELNDLLGNLALIGGSIGFVETKGAEVLAKGLEYFCYALDIEPKIGIADRIYPIKGPVHLDKTTIVQEYERKSYNGYVDSSQTLEKVYSENRDILSELEDFGLKVKK